MLSEEAKRGLIIDGGHQILRRAQEAFERGEIKGYRVFLSEKWFPAIDTICITDKPNDAEIARVRWPEAFNARH